MARYFTEHADGRRPTDRPASCAASTLTCERHSNTPWTPRRRSRAGTRTAPSSHTALYGYLGTCRPCSGRARTGSPRCSTCSLTRRGYAAGRWRSAATSARCRARRTRPWPTATAGTETALERGDRHAHRPRLHLPDARPGHRRPVRRGARRRRRAEQPLRRPTTCSAIGLRTLTRAPGARGQSCRATRGCAAPRTAK